MPADNGTRFPAASLSLELEARRVTAVFCLLQTNSLLLSVSPLSICSSVCVCVCATDKHVFLLSACVSCVGMCMCG